MMRDNHVLRGNIRVLEERIRVLEEQNIEFYTGMGRIRDISQSLLDRGQLTGPIPTASSSSRDNTSDLSSSSTRDNTNVLSSSSTRDNTRSIVDITRETTSRGTPDLFVVRGTHFSENNPPQMLTPIPNNTPGEYSFRASALPEN